MKEKIKIGVIGLGNRGKNMAKKIFGVKRAVVVTQKYHEYRALYIGQRLGMKVKGVKALDVQYAGQGFRDIREIGARDKDFFTAILQPTP